MRRGWGSCGSAFLAAAIAYALVACGSDGQGGLGIARPSDASITDASTSDTPITDATITETSLADALIPPAQDVGADGGEEDAQADASSLDGDAFDPWAPLGSLDDLPFLRSNALALHASSCDPKQQNADQNNALKTDALGDRVIFDALGPGVVYRTWFTGIDVTARIKMYFDDETTPRVSMTFAELFDGTHSPFLTPLVSADTGSSGGFYSYVPLPYAKSLRITTTGPSFYDNFDAHTFPKGTPIASFDGIDHGARARSLWSSVDTLGDLTPKAGTVSVSGVASPGPLQATTLFDSSGPRQVRSLALTIPGLFGNQPVQPLVVDNGRAHRGLSQFRMAIDPSGGPVTLHRRLDYGVPDQTADIYVDSVKVGTWSNAGSDSANRWRDADFAIPASFTAGKSAITVATIFVSSALDWNEFAYWTTTSTNGSDVVSDKVDVGDAASEALHAYLISGQTWSGDHDAFTYPPILLRIDDGRAHRGTSDFTIKIDPKNTGVTLRRRMDYSVADQAAAVSIDGASVGIWSTPGSDKIHPWRDAAFMLPAASTAGKSAITVHLQFQASAIDWNEFTYWAESTIGGQSIITDTLDIGNTASESAHGYAISGQTWHGVSVPFTYPDLDELARATGDLWLRASWDGETTPSLYAPLNALAGVGPFGPSPGVSRALAFGMREDGTFYLRFPMPFETHATIELVNRGALPSPAVAYAVSHAPFNASFDHVGTLHAQYNIATPSTTGRDLVFLDIAPGAGLAAGQVVGVTYACTGPKVGGSSTRWYLEGNERAQIDGARTPVIQGTGTEDFFNGGWYFITGPFALPTHGNTNHSVDFVNDSTSAYRLFLSDPIPFQSGIHFTIQHAASDELDVTAATLAYYYAKASGAAPVAPAPSDALVVGDPASEAAHAYAVTNLTWAGTRSFSFEGENASTVVTASGRAHAGESRFDLAIDPSNHGIVLRRQFDQAVGNQRANVYVDGALVGAFYKSGSNGTNRWREEDLLVPASLVQGKASIGVRIAFVSSDLDWNEFRYEAYSRN